MSRFIIADWTVLGAVRDDKLRTKDKDDRGYGLPLIATGLTTAAEDVIARYASRWSVEAVFATPLWRTRVSR